MSRVALYANVGPELTRYDVDVAQAALTRKESVTLPAGVQYAWPHANRRFLYVATSSSASGYGRQGSEHHVSAFRIDPASGALAPHGRPIPLPTRPIHLTTDIASRHILVAFNNPSALRVYRVNDDFTPGAEVTPTAPVDAGVFAHQVRVTPDDRLAILVTRGNEGTATRAEDPGALKVFDYDDGVLSNEVSIAPDGGTVDVSHRRRRQAHVRAQVRCRRRRRADVLDGHGRAVARQRGSRGKIGASRSSPDAPEETMKRVFRVCAAACLLSIGAQGQAADAPRAQFQRPLRMIVPFPPGGGQDTLGRLVGAKLSEIAGQQVIVDNRPGGGGIIAAEATLKAPADGHTMYIASTSFVVTPSLYKSLSFDSVRDFAPIMRISSSPGTLVVHASLPVRNVRDFIALAKSRPGQITFGSAGIASNSHLSGELFKVLAGVDIVHVPYKGSAQAATALLSGEIVLSFSNAITTLPHVRAGRLKLLGITTRKRSTLLPDAPTIAEAGVPGFENMIWSGVVVHGATPRPAQAALHAAISRTIEAPEIRERLGRDGAEPFLGDTPAEYGAFIAAEIAKWGKVVRAAGLQPQ